MEIHIIYSILNNLNIKKNIISGLLENLYNNNYLIKYYWFCCILKFLCMGIS